MEYLGDNYLKGNPDKFHLLLGNTEKINSPWILKIIL